MQGILAVGARLVANISAAPPNNAGDDAVFVTAA
jgi:hypothetical protein